MTILRKSTCSIYFIWYEYFSKVIKNMAMIKSAI